MTRSPSGIHKQRGASAVPVGFLTYALDRPLSGITRYAVELATALESHADEAALTLLNPFSSPPACLGGLFPSSRLRGRLLPAFMLAGPPQIALAARRHGLHVVHDPMGVSPFLIPRRLASFGRVVTIHDMIPFVHPETHAWLTNLLFHHYIPRTLRFVDRILTDSEASKRDIVRFFSAPPERVEAIYCGVDARFEPLPRDAVIAALDHLGISRPYVLTVGALQQRKNLGVLFEAYAALRARGLPHRLVVVGRKAWKYEATFRRLAELGLEDDVIFTGYVADEDLPAAYAGASAFVFPSLYEGFGLPPLEAMACGVPVITSNTSSLPEVVGDAGIMLDPHDVRGFTHALERVLTDDDLRRDLRARGLARAATFTWDRAAQQHIAVYRRVADRYRPAGSSRPRP